MSVERFCTAETKVGHEKFSCGLYAYEHEVDEERPHEWYGGVWPPCPKCWGLDEHSQSCSEPKVSYLRPGAYIVWKDGQKPKIMRRYKYEAKDARHS